MDFEKKRVSFFISDKTKKQCVERLKILSWTRVNFPVETKGAWLELLHVVYMTEELSKFMKFKKELIKTFVVWALALTIHVKVEFEQAKHSRLRILVLI